MYFTYRQFSFRGFNIVVRGQGDAGALVGAVRTSVLQLDPKLPLVTALAACFLPARRAAGLDPLQGLRAD